MSDLIPKPAEIRERLAHNAMERRELAALLKLAVRRYGEGPESANGEAKPDPMKLETK